MYNDSHDILYSFIIPLISTILGFFAIFISGNSLPEGQRRTGILFFYSFCTIGFLLFLLQTLPLNPQTSDMLKRLTFFCLISIPVIFSMTIIKRRESGEYIDWFAASSITMLLLFSILYATQNTLPIFVIYIPILTVCTFHSYKAFSESITPAQQTENFRNFCIQILLSITPPIAFLLCFDWQDASFLILIIPLWTIFEIWKIQSGNRNEDFDLRIAADYASPVLLFTFLVLIFRGVTELSDNIRNIDFTYRIRPIPIVILALTGTLLFEPFKEYLKTIINTISKRYVDNFTSTLNEIQGQRKNFSFEEIQDQLLKHFPDIETSVLFRLPFKKIFKVSHIFRNHFFDAADSLFIGEKMLQDFKNNGYTIINPGSIENFSIKSDFMKKALSIVEKSDILLIPLFDSPDEFPGIIFTFIQREKNSFPPYQIRNLYHWVNIIKSSILPLWKIFSPEKIELSDEFIQTFTPGELAHAAEKLLSLQTPLNQLYMFIWNEKSETFYVYPEGSEIQEEIITIINDEVDTKFNHHPAEEKNEIWEESNVILRRVAHNRILLKMPSTVNARCFVYLKFDEDTFYFGPSTQQAFDDFSLQTGLFLDKLHISQELEEHRELVDILEDKVNTQALKVAEDLHDTVAQEMYAAKMLVEMLEKQMKGTAPHTKEDIKILRSAVDEGLKKIRNMIVKLREVKPEKTEDIINDLKDFSLKVESETGMKIVFQNMNITNHFSHKIIHEISMIIREGINNARKHSGASRLLVIFSSKGDEISLEIRDNGRGFTTNIATKNNSFGIAGMRSRCNRLGGELNIISSPGKGTAIIATLNRTHPK